MPTREHYIGFGCHAPNTNIKNAFTDARVQELARLSELPDEQLDTEINELGTGMTKTPDLQKRVREFCMMITAKLMKKK